MHKLYSDLVTIAIPYHSNLRYLEETIDSVSKQTLLPCELILCDDSGDAQAEHILAKYPYKHRYVNSSQVPGIASNWNRCILEARSLWVTILHADDRIKPGYVKEMDNAIRRDSSVAGFFCLADTINSEGRKIFFFRDWLKKRVWLNPSGNLMLKGESGLARLLFLCFISTPSVCYQKALIGQDPFDRNLSMTLDWDFFCSLMLKGETLGGIRRNLFQYRRHEGSTTSCLGKNGIRFKEEKECARKYSALAKEKKWYLAYFIGRASILHRLYHLLGWRIG